MGIRLASQRPGDVGFVTLSGSSGSYVYTTDKAALDITGDITLIAYVAPNDWTPGAKQALVAKRAASNFSYMLASFTSSTNPFISMEWSADGSTGRNANTSYAGLVTDGVGMWVAAQLDVDDGASSHLATFYRSSDPPGTAIGAVTWTTVGTATASGGGTTSLFSGSARLEIGSISSGTASLTAGKAYRAAVKSGLMSGGTIVADWSKGVGTDAYGNTWVEP